MWCALLDFCGEQVWRYSAATENFTLVRNEIRSWREERESESLARDWGTGRPLRPASAYQAAQHGAAMGDSCYGDAGGSVWKFWRFQQTKLAVLTGVVSRCCLNIIFIQSKNLRVGLRPFDERWEKQVDVVFAKK